MSDSSAIVRAFEYSVWLFSSPIVDTKLKRAALEGRSEWRGEQVGSRCLGRRAIAWFFFKHPGYRKILEASESNEYMNKLKLIHLRP